MDGEMLAPALGAAALAPLVTCWCPSCPPGRGDVPRVSEGVLDLAVVRSLRFGFLL